MYPLNTFPRLLDYYRFSFFIVRVIVGLFIIALGKERQDKKSVLAYVYYVCGATILAGYYTQVSAIVGIILLKFDFYVDYWRERENRPVPKHFYFLYAMAGLILVSLIFSGAGMWAFDMPF